MTTHADFAKRAWSCYVDQVTAAVTTQFETHGVPSILLKGPGFEALLFDVDDGRYYRDTDLLVQVRDRARAEDSCWSIPALSASTAMSPDSDLLRSTPGPFFARVTARSSTCIGGCPARPRHPGRCGRR